MYMDKEKRIRNLLKMLCVLIDEKKIAFLNPGHILFSG